MKQKRKKPKILSIRELARRTGADRASIKKWIEGVTDEKEALRIIEERKRRPEEELSWFQQKAKEETIKLRRINEIAEKVKAEEWMATVTHHAIVTLIIGQLELLPGKARSQLGLDPRQTTELQRMIDEVRSNAARDIEVNK